MEAEVDKDQPVSLASRVQELFSDCLYEESELPPGGPEESGPSLPQDAIVVDGITMKFGLDPKKVQSNKAKIESLIDEIVPESFYEDAGGGMSFLSLCNTKTGDQWAEHPTMQEFFVLAAAIGRARFCMPRGLWGLLPGGMPYIQFTRTGGS